VPLLAPPRLLFRPSSTALETMELEASVPARPIRRTAPHEARPTSPVQQSVPAGASSATPVDLSTPAAADLAAQLRKTSPDAAVVGQARQSARRGVDRDHPPAESATQPVGNDAGIRAPGHLVASQRGTGRESTTIAVPQASRPASPADKPVLGPAVPAVVRQEPLKRVGSGRRRRPSLDLSRRHRRLYPKDTCRRQRL